MNGTALSDKIILRFTALLLNGIHATVGASVTFQEVVGCSLEIAMYAACDYYLLLIGCIDRFLVGVAVAPYVLSPTDKLLCAYRLIIGAMGTAVTFDVHFRFLLEVTMNRTSYYHGRIVVYIAYLGVAVFVAVLLACSANKLFLR